jgi:hypothetical protein
MTGLQLEADKKKSANLDTMQDFDWANSTINELLVIQNVIDRHAANKSLDIMTCICTRQK